ncbi:hypothetical protein [Nocardia sp. NPDC049707]
MRSRTTIDRLIARRDIDIREKTLWRMLYENAPAQTNCSQSTSKTST